MSATRWDGWRGPIAVSRRETTTGVRAWFGGAHCASLVFALLESLEWMFAAWLQECRSDRAAPGPGPV